MNLEHLLGSWSLVSYERRSVTGEVTYPLGREAAGRLIYSPDGYMAVVIVRAGRPPFASEEPLGGAPEERAAAAESCLSYSGRYHVEGRQVFHSVDLSLFPNWAGRQQQRLADLHGDTLVLTTPPRLIDGVECVSTLVWQRP